MSRRPEGADPIATLTDDAAEQAVCGAVICAGIRGDDIYTALAEIVTREDFHNPRYAVAWDAFGALVRKGVKCDVGTVGHELTAMDRLQAVGGAQWVYELADLMHTYVHAEEHARRVAEFARRRRIYDAARFIAMKAPECFSGDELATYAAETLRKASASREIKRGAYFKDAVDPALKAFEDSMMGAGRAVRTGIACIDDRIGLWRPKEVITIAAKTGGGKTTFVMQVSVNVARSGRTVVFFSLEMSRDELIMKLACGEVGVSYSRFEMGQVGGKELNAVVVAAEELRQLPIYVDDGGDLTADKARSIVLREQMHADVGLVVVDYLHLMDAMNPKAEPSHQLALSMKTLKGAAMKTDVPWCVLSQFNQEGAKRDGKPKLGDMLGSGAIGHFSNKVIFLHRDEDNPENGMAPTEALIRKNRNGWTGKIDLMFDLVHGRFTGASEDSPSSPDAYRVGGMKTPAKFDGYDEEGFERG